MESKQVLVVEDKELCCAVCLELFKDPRVLPCLHTYCYECLHKLVADRQPPGETQASSNSTLASLNQLPSELPSQTLPSRAGPRACPPRPLSLPRLLTTETKLKCPSCRAEHDLPSKGVSGFLPNSTICSQVESHNFARASPQGCGLCTSRSAGVVSFCLDCQKPLCEQCNDSHKRQMQQVKDHEVVAPSEAKFKSKPISYPCPDHPCEELKVYCNNCEAVICRDCALYTHNQHTFKPAEDAASEICKKLSALEDRIKTKVKVLERNAEQVQEVQKHLVAHPDKLKAEIISTFNNLSQELEKRKQCLLTEVESRYDAFTKQLGGEEDLVDMILCSLQSSLKFASRVQRSTHNLEVAVLGIKAVTRMKAIEKSSWNPETVEKLGPLFFDPSATPSHLEYARAIGEILDVKSVVLSIKQPRARHRKVYYKNGSFSLGAQYTCTVHIRFSGSTFGCAEDFFFERSTLSSDVRNAQMEAVSSQVTGSMCEGDCAIAFTPAVEGEHVIQASLVMANKVCCSTSITASFTYQDQHYVLEDFVRPDTRGRSHRRYVGGITIPAYD